MELSLETALACTERASSHPHLNEEFQKITTQLKLIITCTTVPCTTDNRCLLQCQVEKGQGMVTSLQEDVDELKNLLNKYLEIFHEPRFREYYYQEVENSDEKTPYNYPTHIQEGVGMYFIRDKRKLKKISVEMEGIYNKLHFKNLEVKGTIVRPPRPAILKELAIGDKITCRFYIKESNQWTMEYYNATIKRVNQSSNTFDCRYDTGERVNSVPRNYIRFAKEPIPVEKKDSDDQVTNKFTQDPVEAVAKLQNAIGQVSFDQMKKDKAILHALANIMLLSDDGDESNNNLLLGRAKVCEIVLTTITPISSTNDTIINYACRVIRSLTNGCADNKAQFRACDIFHFIDDIMIAQNASQQTKQEAMHTRKQLIAANGPQFKEGELMHASKQYKVFDGRYTANFETMQNDKSSWSMSSLDKSLDEHNFGQAGFIHPQSDQSQDRKENAMLRRYQNDHHHVHANSTDYEAIENLKIAKLKNIPTFDTIKTVSGAIGAFNMIDSFKDQLAANVACNAIACTRRLCKENKKLRQELLNAGACELIVKISNRFLDAIDVIIIATKAISDISMNEDSRTALRKAGACELIVKFMKNYLFSSTICMYVCCSVYNMAYQHDDNKMLLGKLGCCEAILTVFVHQAKMTRVELWVCYGIGSLAHGNEFNKRRLHASDVEDYLVNIMKRVAVLDPIKLTVEEDGEVRDGSDQIDSEKVLFKKKSEGVNHDYGKLVDSVIYACRHVSHLSGTICTKMIRLKSVGMLITCLNKFGMNPVLNLNGILGMHSCSKDIVSNSILTLRSLLSTANNDVEEARQDMLDSGIVEVLFKLLQNINAGSNSDYVLQKYIVWIIKLLLEGDSKRLVTATSIKIGKTGIMQEILFLLLRLIRSFNKLKSVSILPSINSIDSSSASDENQLVEILDVVYRVLKALLNLTVGRYFLINYHYYHYCRYYYQ